MIFSNAVNFFLEVAKQQSLTKASESLYVSRQAVSKQIQYLEHELGVQLFERNSRQLSITPAGVMYYNFFSRIMSEWDDLREQSQALARNAPLRIGCVKGINIEHQTADLLNSCIDSAHPLQMVWERNEPFRLYHQLTAKELDLIFTFDHAEQDGIVKHVFLQTEYVLAAGRRLPGLDSVEHITDFERYPFLTWCANGAQESVARSLYQQLGARCGLSMRRITMMPNMESTHTSVEMGAGVSICNSLDQLCFSEQVCTYPLGIQDNICVFYRKEENTPEITALIKSIEKALTTR